MSTHTCLGPYIRIAFGCMACDGEIAPPEIQCLRSIAIQLGEPAEAVDPALAAAGAEFAADPSGVVRQATDELREAGLASDDAVLLLRILVQMAEADGTVRAAERRFIQETVEMLALDRERLLEGHPEWALYLAPTLAVERAPGKELEWFREAVEKIPDLPGSIEPTTAR